MVHLRLIASTIALNLWTITGISLQLQPGGEDQSTESKLEESLANVDKKIRTIIRKEALTSMKTPAKAPIARMHGNKTHNLSVPVIAELVDLRDAIDRHQQSGKIGSRDDGKLALTQEQVQSRNSTPNWEAFAISLKRRPQRLQGFIQAVQKQEPWLLGKISFVWATDGQEIWKNEEAQHLLVEKGYVSQVDMKQALKEPGGVAVSWWDLSPGAIGCYISHAKVWEQIVSKDLDYGLIFEDDMRHFRPDFEKIVRTGSLENPKADGDIVYLQHCSGQWDRGSDTPPEGMAELHKVDNDLIVPCTAGYLVSNKAARQLLQNAFPMQVQLDRAMAGSAVEGLSRLRYEPALAQVGNESAVSDVQESSSGASWLLQLIKFKVGDLLGMYDSPDNSTAKNSSASFARWFLGLASSDERANSSDNTTAKNSSDIAQDRRPQPELSRISESAAKDTQ
jgi:GR25 family glycosyltransferase involved in LPS biosynthesis